jgi:hypothetical protein
VSEGEYVVVAVANSHDGVSALSRPRPVTVKGADVTRIDLKLLPLGSLSGRTSLQDDPALGCKTKTGNTLAAVLFSLKEVVLSLKRDGQPKGDYPSFIQSQLTYAASPDATGQFTMKRVPAGAYKVDVWLPNPDWYVSAITQGSGSGATAARPPHYVASQGISVGEGQAVSRLDVVIKNGAAGLSGRIVIEKGASTTEAASAPDTPETAKAIQASGATQAAGAPKPAASPADHGAVLPLGLMVYLTPVGEGRVAGQLRSYETEAASDGTYQFKNLPPARYRIAVHSVLEQEHPQSTGGTVQQAAHRLAKDDHKAPLIELHPCERRTDYALSYLQRR